MDRDIKIIEAVRKEPCLYVNNFNIEERNRGWKQLSEKLKMKDQHLKIRWHLLVQRYQSDSSFKYAQQMDFVERKSKRKVLRGNWPEFEINEEDMLATRQNSEEYVFLHVEDLEENSSPDPGHSAVKEENGDEDNDVSSECQDYSSLSYPIVPTINDSNKCDKNANKTGMLPKCSEIKKEIEKNPYKLSTKKQTLPCVPQPVTSVVEKTTEAAPPKLTTDRCEDDIFGELVAAMLKRMDADKKRMVKKEIMNLLLT